MYPLRMLALNGTSKSKYLSPLPISIPESASFYTNIEWRKSTSEKALVMH